VASGLPSMSRLVRYGLIAALALAGVALFMLAAASGNTRAFERNYPILLALNGAICSALFVLVVVLVVRLVRRYRAGRFGSHLMARFAIALALTGVLPGVLIYFVSAQFLSRSIESWFDVRVDRALESGLTLGRAVLEAQRDDVSAKARSMAQELSEVTEPMLLQTLDRLRVRDGIDQALILGVAGGLVGASGAPPGELAPERPSPAELRAARIQRSFASIEGDAASTEPRSGLRIRVLVAIPSGGARAGGSAADAGRDVPSTPPSYALVAPTPPGFAPPVPLGEPLFLQLIQPVQSTVAANAQALQAGYSDYQQLSLSRKGLQKIYGLTLALTLLLAIFASIAAGVVLASSMTAPLVQLAAGTRAVAGGDFRPVREFPGNDELNLLTHSFNAMTRQLRDARDAVEARSRELENARAYLERVLANLSAGVIVLDGAMRLVTANHGAGRILGVALADRSGRALADLVPQLAAAVERAFADQLLAATPKDSWQHQIQLMRAGHAAGDEPLALLARGSRLPLEEGQGYVVVFDDITQVISAQRAVAWGEVARRLAHEIKNPLTPIQLAAERLQMKLADHLPPEHARTLARGAMTIVNQVAAMKRMVDEFRDYARLPVARPLALDLNALIDEIGALYGAELRGTHGPPGGAGNIGAPGTSAPARAEPEHGAILVELHLAESLPLIEGDPAQLRQVIHNLVVNAQESILGQQRALAAAALPAPAGRIVLRTETVAIDAPGRADGQALARAVRLSVEDNGAGFPANILRRAFEPYVTSKPSGTGLGLAMVKKIVEEHGARIELINRTGGGTGTGGATVTVVFRRLAGGADGAREAVSASRPVAAEPAV
jgi:nitrogen fixation/metabolism regulation signal transduction histidine kinase